MIKAYGYTRVSSKNQIDGDGFDRQEDAIREYASKHDIEIETIYQEDVSGVKNEDDRPAFQDMITAIMGNGVRTIIIERLDRLAREYRVQESLIIYLASKGITLINATTEEDVTDAVCSDPMKKALIQMQGIFAELEKNLLVKKLRVARERKKAKTGKCEGRKSYSESNPEIIREIKRLRRKSKNRKPMSFSQIATYLNDNGHRTLTGGLFTTANVQMLLKRSS